MLKYLKLVVIGCAFFFAVNSYALQIYRTGSPRDASTLTTQEICLAGGGNDLGWAGGWQRLLESTNGGDILIVRADQKRGGYEKWIYRDKLQRDKDRMGFPSVNSVTTLLLEKATDADDPRVEKLINESEMIFFAGGNQTDYINWFDHSRFGKALKTAIEVRKISVAGTSAGMALLAGIRYWARFDSPADGGLVRSNEVLNNPTGVLADLDRNPIKVPLLKNVITETHFAQRDRYGRVVGFMANAIYTGLASLNQVKSISSDYGTAFCFGPNGEGQVYGFDNVYFMKPLAPPEVLQIGQPLTWDADSQAIEVQILKNGDRFRLSDWKVVSDFSTAFTQYWSVLNGTLVRPADGPAEPLN